MNKVVLTMLVIPLLIVLAVRDPQGAGHLVESIITVGAKLLDTVAKIIGDILGSPAQ